MDGYIEGCFTEIIDEWTDGHNGISIVRMLWRKSASELSTFLNLIISDTEVGFYIKFLRASEEELP